MKLSEQIKEYESEHLIKTQSKRIVSDIQKLSVNKKTMSRRWLYELIQNAIDTAKSFNNDELEIEIYLNEEKNEFTFSHNAGYFQGNEILAILYGGSTKGFSELDLIGQFGSGFLVTHILSRKVTLESYIKEKEQEIIYQFSVNIDRSSDNSEEIKNNINNCFIGLDKQQTNGIVPKNKIITKFIYTDIDIDVCNIGISELKSTLYFILKFNQIKHIKINNDTYSKQLTDNENEIDILVNNDKAFKVVSKQNENVEISILLSGNTIIDIAKIPKIFIAVPLTKTADYITIPFVINSRKFKTVETRDTLSAIKHENNGDFEINLNLLSEASDLYKNIVSNLLHKDEIHLLFNLKPIQDDVVDENPLWNKFNEVIKELIEELVVKEVIDTTISTKTSLSNCIFPVLNYNNRNIEKLNLFNEFYQIVDITKNNIPKFEIYTKWFKVASTICQYSNSHLKQFTINDLIDECNSSVDNFGNTFPSFDKVEFETEKKLDRDFLISYYQFIDKLYSLEIFEEKFVKNLIPSNKSIIGTKKRKWTNSDIGFKMCLKDVDNRIDEIIPIVDKIGRDINGELIHSDFSEFKIIQHYFKGDTLKLHDIFDNLTKEDYYKLPEQIDFDDNSNRNKVEGWITLFKWCVVNNELFEGIFILNNENKTLTYKLEIDKPTLFLPFDLLNLSVEYEELYKGKILNSKYFDENIDEAVLAEDFLEKIKQNNYFISSFPIKIKETNIKKNKLILLTKEEVISNEHKIITNNDDIITDIPFWNEIIGKTGNNIDKSKLFFKLIIEILANDKFLSSEINVNCSCQQKEHKIIPTKWLSHVKNDAWLAFEKETDEGVRKIETREASKENILKLYTEQEFNSLLNEKISNNVAFLEHFEFDTLDLSLKLKSAKNNIKETNLRSNTSHLIEIVDTSDIEKVGSISNDKKEKFKNDFKKLIQQCSNDNNLQQDNYKIGKFVEKVIENEFSKNNIKIEYTGIGSDYEIWTNEEDETSIDINQLKIQTEDDNNKMLEIKFTINQTVHLSKRQGEEAKEQEEKYHVIVVHTSDEVRSKILDADINNIDNGLSSTIISKSHVIDKINEKLLIKNDDSIVPDIKGYWLKSDLWFNKLKLSDWIKNMKT